MDVGVIYPIVDSKWVIPTQVVPKKSGVTVVANEHNEHKTFFFIFKTIFTQLFYILQSQS